MQKEAGKGIGGTFDVLSALATGVDDSSSDEDGFNYMESADVDDDSSDEEDNELLKKKHRRVGH